jgi:hypothetical protein
MKTTAKPPTKAPSPRAAPARTADPSGLLALQRMAAGLAGRQTGASSDARDADPRGAPEIRTRSLPDATTWSRRLGADLSRVRIATGPAPEQVTRAMNARALTVGQTVLFGNDAYRPDTAQGQHVIAHELAHTVQNAGGAPTEELAATRVGDAREHEAHRAADAVIAGQPAPRITPGRSMVAALPGNAAPYVAPDAATEADRLRLALVRHDFNGALAILQGNADPDAMYALRLAYGETLGHDLRTRLPALLFAQARATPPPRRSSDCSACSSRDPRATR